MVLVERRDALARLTSLFADSIAGVGRLALVSGGLASGKTALLHAFCDYAAERGALVLTATGSRAESALQMGVIGQLLHSAALPAEVTELASRLGAAGAAQPAEADPDPLAIRPADAPLVQGLCAALLTLAKDRPVVLGIDDVQFVDRASQHVLLYLQRRIRSAHVLMVLSERAQPRPTQARFRAELTRHPHHRVRLDPLSERGVAELLSHFLETPAATLLAPGCHAVSGGNPLLVHALIEDYRAGGADPGGEPGDTGLQPVVGDAFGHAVLACLHRCEPQLLDIARAIALLGDHASPALVGRLTGTTSDSAAQAFEVLTAARLLTGVGRFRHPGAAAAIVDSLAAQDRSALHAQAAELLHRHGASALEVGRHLVAAGTVTGPWSEVLREAARQADDDVELAVQCLELAVRVSTDEPERDALTRALALMQWRINPCGSAAHLGPLCAALDAGDLRGEDAVIVVRQLLWQGNSDALEKALAGLDGSTDPADAQMADELRLAYQWIYGSSRHLPAEQWSRTGPDHGQPGALTGNMWARASATLAALFAQGASEDVVESAERILQRCRLGDSTLEVVGTALLVLIYADKVQAAGSWCDTLLADAARRHATTWRAVLGSIRADIALRQGDLAGAEAHARTALGLLPARSWGVLIGYPVSVLMLAYTLTGRRDAAAGLLKQAVPDAMFQTVFGLRYLHARGHYYLAADRVLAALGDFQTCGRLMTEWDLDVPALVPWRSDLARAQLRLDRPRVARDLVAKQLEQPRAIGFRTRGISLRVLAAASDLRQRLPLLREAINLLQGCGDRFQLARALGELSQAHHELGDFSRARMLARWAAQQAEACHPDALPKQLSVNNAARDDGESADEQAEDDGVPALSDAELRVASLAALGHTNREIGRRLFITVSTVEQHLTRVYRKLKVNSRADLPTGLSVHDMSTSA